MGQWSSRYSPPPGGPHVVRSFSCAQLDTEPGLSPCRFPGVSHSQSGLSCVPASPSCWICTSVPLSQDIIRKALRNVKACVLIWRGGEQGSWSEVPHLAASVGVGSEMAEWLLTDGDEEKGSQPEILSRDKRAPGLKLVVRKCLANLRASQRLA